MTTLTRAYGSTHDAEDAIKRLSAAVAKESGIRLLTSRPLTDISREPVGGFAGPVGADAPVGTFAGRVHRRGDDAGSFATGSSSGDAHHKRQGSFGDVERVTIMTHEPDAQRSRVTGHRGIRMLLRRAALDDDAIGRAVDELNNGRAVVLVDVREIALVETEAQLEHLAKAA